MKNAAGIAIDGMAPAFSMTSMTIYRLADSVGILFRLGGNHRETESKKLICTPVKRGEE
jgi:hypothetical protein